MEELLGQSLCFLAEHNVNGVGVFNFGIKVRCFCAKIINLSFGVFGIKIVKTVVIGDVELMPIVQPCALELAVVNCKSEWANEVQGRTRRRAGARNVARVLRNFGLVEYNVNFGHNRTFRAFLFLHHSIFFVNVQGISSKFTIS